MISLLIFFISFYFLNISFKDNQSLMWGHWYPYQISDNTCGAFQHRQGCPFAYCILHFITYLSSDSSLNTFIFFLYYVSRNHLSSLDTHPARSTISLISNFLQGRAVRPLIACIEAVRDLHSTEIMAQFLQLPVVWIWNNATKALHIVNGHSLKSWSCLKLEGLDILFALSLLLLEE